jgi:hypothetical protein
VLYASRSVLETSATFTETIPSQVNKNDFVSKSTLTSSFPTQQQQQQIQLQQLQTHPQTFTRKTKESTVVNVLSVMLSEVLSFNGNLSPKNSHNNPQKLEIPVLNIDYETFTQVMQFLYQIDPKIDTLESGLKVLRAADFLQMKTLQNYCANIVSRFITHNTFEEILNHANHVNCKLLKKHCFAWLLNRGDKQYLTKELPLWQIEGITDDIFEWVKKLYTRVTTIENK